MRFTPILVGYFVVGAVLWGGGAIAWSDAGVGQFFIDDPTEGEVDEGTIEDLEGLGGPIHEVSGLGGGLIATWNLLVQLVGFLFWPVTTLQGAGAPPQVWVLLGGTPTVAFYGALLRIVRTSV